MEWIIAIIAVIVIAWIAISVARRGSKGGEGPATGEQQRTEPGERDDMGPPGAPDPDEGLEPLRDRPPGEADPDEGPEPPRDRPPGDRFD